MILRPYQRECVDAVLSAYDDGAKSVMYVAATGAGKTVIASHIIKAMLDRHPRKRVLVLAHRQELIYQAQRAIRTITDEFPQIEMGLQWANPNATSRVTISTVQTQTASRGGRMDRFKPNDHCLVWVDECHRAVSPSFRKTIDYYTKHSDCLLLGCTATPQRADEEALGQVFDTCAYTFDIQDAVDQAWLVPIRENVVKVHGLDFSNLRTIAGDFSADELAAELTREDARALHGMVNASMGIVGDRQAVVFTPTVAVAQQMAELYNRANPGCAYIISGETGDEERKRILRRFDRGEFHYLCNCATMTEGWDSPNCSCVVLARPTKSELLFRQMIGRGTRPLPGVVDGILDVQDRRDAIAESNKKHMTVIDFTGNCGRHSLISVADVLGGKHSDAVIERAKRIIHDGETDVQAALEKADKLENEEILARARAKKGLVGKANWTVEERDPFGMFKIKPTRERGWDKMRPPTEKQKAVLDRAGINYEGMNNTEIKALLRSVFDRRDKNLATHKQVKALRRYGIDAVNMRFEDASACMDAIAKNGWRRPSVLPVEAGV